MGSHGRAGGDVVFDCVGGVWRCKRVCVAGVVERENGGGIVGGGDGESELSMNDLYSFIGLIVGCAIVVGGSAYTFYRIISDSADSYLLLFIPVSILGYLLWPIFLLAGIGVVLSGPLLVIRWISSNVQK